MSEQPKAVKQKDSGAKSKDISPSKEMHDKYLQFVELIIVKFVTNMSFNCVKTCFNDCWPTWIQISNSC